MTLRLSDADTEALRLRAAAEGRSMQDIVHRALREYLDATERRERIDAVLDTELPRYADALRRLGE
jgi:plasmid stability protein